MWCHSEWEYFVGKDVFQFYFPNGDYDIYTLAEWYRVIPTQPEKISYYGDNIPLLKQHFENFAMFDSVKTKVGNDLHSNTFLTVWCMAIYNTESELVGFAAQEYINGKAADKKILYFGELRE